MIVYESNETRYYDQALRNVYLSLSCFLILGRILDTNLASARRETSPTSVKLLHFVAQSPILFMALHVPKPRKFRRRLCLI